MRIHHHVTMRSANAAGYGGTKSGTGHIVDSHQRGFTTIGASFHGETGGDAA